jgi:glyoxylase-like metal-dependent hydrolase (beta-lactamase superfamily II)
MPLFVPEHRALVFGDAIVAADGAVRVWIQLPVTPKRLDWYQRRLRPSFEPLLDVDCDRLLVTHGQPVLTGGRRALREALDEGPWYHRPN